MSVLTRRVARSRRGTPGTPAVLQLSPFNGVTLYQVIARVNATTATPDRFRVSPPTPTPHPSPIIIIIIITDIDRGAFYPPENHHICFRNPNQSHRKPQA